MLTSGFHTCTLTNAHTRICAHNTHKASLENLTISGFDVFDFKVALCMCACTCVCICVCLHVSVPYMRFCRVQRRTLDVIFYHFTPSSLDTMCLSSLPSHPHPTPIGWLASKLRNLPASSVVEYYYN